MLNLYTFFSYFRQNIFYTGESNNMNRGLLARKQRFEVKHVFMNMQLFASQDVNWWTEVVSMDYCDVFISCLDSHSDGTHSLQRIHWWACNVILHFSKYVTINKLILDDLRASTFSEKFHSEDVFSLTKKWSVLVLNIIIIQSAKMLILCS